MANDIRRWIMKWQGRFLIAIGVWSTTLTLTAYGGAAGWIDRVDSVVPWGMASMPILVAAGTICTFIGAIWSARTDERLSAAGAVAALGTLPVLFSLGFWLTPMMPLRLIFLTPAVFGSLTICYGLWLLKRSAD